jgi:hypothetical protein
VVYYRWHPLYGRSARRIQSERRASGEFVHVELTPGVVTIVPAWKLDPVFCAGLKIGAPLVSLTALASLHELLVALESRLPLRTAPPSLRRRIMGSLILLAQGTELAPRRPSALATAPGTGTSASPSILIGGCRR